MREEAKLLRSIRALVSELGSALVEKQRRPVENQIYRSLQQYG